MILHILTDDKFTDYVINQFEAPEMQSEFVLIPINGEPSLVQQMDKVRIVRYPSADFDDLLLHLEDYTGIVLHGLFGRFNEDVLRVVPNNVKVAWMFWGGEIYSRSELYDAFLAPITRTLCHLHSWSKKSTTHTSYQLPLELYQRIDCCLTSIDEEYVYAKQFVQSNRMELIWYNYYSIEDTIGTLMQSRCTGTNVFFCNSAAEKNNMFDAIFKLSLPQYRRHLQGRKIIMPLSYGAPWIRNAMKRLGKFFFGKRFVSILDYLPREEYNKLMLDCGTIILPYWQPAAHGNILTSLWLGMRVYLSECSMAYFYFKRIGASVFSLESDFVKYGCTPIKEEEFQTNRLVLKQWYGKEHILQCAKSVVEKLQ